MTDWKQSLTKQIFKESSFTNTVTISCDGGEEMICPKCGFSGNFIVNGDRFCASCSCFIAKAFPSEPPSISGLEKIEPLEGGLTVIDKLNEVIEKVNRIMEVMNRR